MGAQCHACIGGTSVRGDMSKLDAGQHIVVGTPGRVFDMISRKVSIFVPFHIFHKKKLLHFHQYLRPVSFVNDTRT